METDYISREAAVKKFSDRLQSISEEYICKIAEEIPPADVRPVVYCVDCKHAPEPGGSVYGLDVRFPDDACPFNCPDHWYNARPAPEFFCAKGERRKEEP